MAFQINTSGFSIKEGNYLLKIANVTENEVNHRIMVTYTTETGRKFNELYCIMNANGTINDVASRTFSWLCICALNDRNISSVEITDLIGKYIRADLLNDKYTSKDGIEKQTVKVIHKEATDEVFEADKVAAEKSDINLDDILGI